MVIHVLNVDREFARSKMLEHSEIISITVTTLVSSMISLLGSASIIIVLLVATRVHRRLFIDGLFHLSIADFMAAIGIVVATTATLLDSDFLIGHIPCVVIRAWLQFWFTSSFFIALLVGLRLLCANSKWDPRDDEDSSNTCNSIPTMDEHGVIINRTTDRLWILGLVMAYSIPIVIVGTLILFGNYDKDDNSLTTNVCLPMFPLMHEASEENHYITVAAVYAFLVPLCVILVSNIGIYILIWRRFRSRLRRSGIYTDVQRREENRLVVNLFLYASVFIICWASYIAISLYTLLEDSLSHSSAFGILILQAFLGPLYGGLNSLVYGWHSKRMIEAWHILCTRFLNIHPNVDEDYNNSQNSTSVIRSESDPIYVDRPRCYDGHRVPEKTYQSLRCDSYLSKSLGTSSRWDSLGDTHSASLFIKETNSNLISITGDECGTSPFRSRSYEG